MKSEPEYSSILADAGFRECINTLHVRLLLVTYS